MRGIALLLVLLPLASMSQDDIWEDEEWEDDAAGTRWSGFVEAGLGTRTAKDPLVDERGTLRELRGRVEAEWSPAGTILSLKADAGYDGIEDEAFGDFRELAVSLGWGGSVDVKVGHQVQTWGTGDLLFLNDLFPKDFVSFFAGREDEYLKAPGSAVRLTRYGSAFNVDLVWTPVFEPDNYITGERFSFFSPLAGGNVSPVPPLSAIEPNESLDNGELALRIFRTVESTEYALYGYRGFFKQPSALTTDFAPIFAPLDAYGASLRRPLGPGLFNTEAAWYRSRDDRDGTNPFVPNDQVRFLAGYEWEAATRLTVGLQYYLEWTLDHDELVATSLAPAYAPDEFRQLLTNRLTYTTGRDRYTWSLFTFLSPTDRDVYLRPQFTLRYSDTWSLTAGGNLFAGDEEHTFFGQFEDASNAYLRLRFHY